MKTFIDFLKHPVYNETFRRIDLKDMIILYASYFVLMIPVGMIIFLISSLFSLRSELTSLSGNDIIIYGVFIAPVAEELIFRLILVFNKRNIIILFAVMFTLSAYYSYRGSYSGIVLLIVIFSLSLMGILFYKSIKRWLIKYYKVFFYLIALLFAFVHIFNFNGFSPSNFFIAAFLVFPQLFLGFILGYIRVSYGIVFSILFHFMVNLPLIFSFN